MNNNKFDEIKNLVLYKSSTEIYENFESEDFTNHFCNVKVPIKLFNYFAHYTLLLNFNFLKILNREFRIVIETWAKKKLNWNNINILLEPEGYCILRNTETNFLYYTSEITLNEVVGILFWYVPKPYFEIDLLHATKFDEELKVIWIAYYGDKSIGKLPEYVEKISKLTFKPKVKFPVYSWLSSMPHEGKFAITLFDIVDVEKVFEALETARCKWNTQTDEARATNNPSLEQGYCHTITFDGVEDNLAYWYIDAGSAHEGIHEYLLRQLSDSDIKIKSVEIKVL